MTTIVCSWINDTKEKTTIHSTLTRYSDKKSETIKYSKDIINESINDPQVTYLGHPTKQADSKLMELKSVALGLSHLKENDKNIILLMSQNAKNIIQNASNLIKPENKNKLMTERENFAYIILRILNDVPNRSYRIYGADHNKINKFLSNNKLSQQTLNKLITR